MRPELTIRGPLYFALGDDGELRETNIIEVGSTPATHTLYWFSTPWGYTAAMVTGEGETMPAEPIIREAEFQLFGAQEVTP